jgi:meso-butanediol dehydrogenase/(S,S)-butanediol dehydrogenase/diacetyl reductase
LKLDGKAALITGGTTGIGYATALLFLENGAKVAITGRAKETGKEAIRKLKHQGFEACSFIQGDVSKLADAERMVKETLRRYGRLDVLFNNAGIWISGDAERTSEAGWDRVIDINLKGCFLCSKFAIPHLKKTKGVIVNTSSCDGLVGEPDAVAYCASKGGVVLLTKAMALDCAKYGVRVNCVCPGYVRTRMLEVDLPQGMSIEKYLGIISKEHPVERIAEPEEVARAVLFLASEDSSFVTGVALSVDGGYTAK